MTEMRQYERNGVVVDQCTECGGLFLDRGELRALAAAERAFYGDVPIPATPPSTAPPLYEDRRYDDRDERHYSDRSQPLFDDRRRYADDDKRYGKRKKSKASSFLENLFDD